MIKMNDREKRHIEKVIYDACGGTPLQPHREFAAGYLGQIICAQIENWIEIRVALAVEEGDLTRIL